KDSCLIDLKSAITGFETVDSSSTSINIYALAVMLIIAEHAQKLSEPDFSKAFTKATSECQTSRTILNLHGCLQDTFNSNWSKETIQEWLFQQVIQNLMPL
ncbi:hypothetical protein JAAARDRAFT_39931, partial [Jaapia argillacea MUCL 33604]